MKCILLATLCIMVLFINHEKLRFQFMIFPFNNILPPQLLYTKPLISLLCMYHLLPEFRSAFLRIIRLEYKLEAPAGLSGHQYERMYTEIDENLSPAATL